MRFPRRRGALRLTRGKLVKMSQERQKLSFFIVVIFLAVFGIIILAEVLSMEEGKNGGGGYGISYEHDVGANRKQSSDSTKDGNAWKTPKPLLQRRSNKLAHQNEKAKNDEYERHLKKHQQEMERLIRNISMKMNLRPGSKVTSSASKDLLPSMINPLAVKSSTKQDSKHRGKKVYSSSNMEEGNGEFVRGGRSGKGLDARWQAVSGIMSHKFFVYSAYYDTRDIQKPVVRVIGVTRTKRSEKVSCRMYIDKKSSTEETFSHKSDKSNNSSTSSDEDNQSFRDVPASIFIIRENWNLKYSACFVICPLYFHTSSASSQPLFIPDAVSIFPTVSSKSKMTSPITNRLPVQNAESGGTGTFQVNKTDVGICVKPIHFQYNKTLELIEFIELNKILGVTKFTFYNHTMSDEVSCVLNYYMNEENTNTVVVSVMPWELDIDSQTEIRTEGLFAALNDCLYRNMNDFNYLMLIDFDEFIIPHMNDTIPEMLDYLNSKKVVTKNGRKLNHPKLTSSYSFQNAFFYLQFEDDEEFDSSRGEELSTQLRVLRKTRRKTKFNPQKQRSKYICIPRQVKEAGNHFIWEFHQGSNINVPTNVGFLHHYRVCEFGGDDCVHAPNQVDRTVHKYQHTLLENVKKVVLKLSDQCKLDYLLLNSKNDIVDPLIPSWVEKISSTGLNRVVPLSHKNVTLLTNNVTSSKYALNLG